MASPSADRGLSRRQRPADGTGSDVHSTGGEADGEPECNNGDDAVEKKRNAGRDRCRIVFTSRLWRCAMLLVVAFIPAFGILVCLPEALDSLGCAGFWSRSKYYIIAIWLATQVLYNFAMAQYTDPGGTAGVAPTFPATSQFLLATGHDAAGEDQDVDIENWKQMGSQDPLMYAPSFCDKSKTFKPPRAHFCSMSGRCILRMDHYCPFVGNCIGFRNHGHFVLMYVHAFLGLMYSLAICVVVTWYNRADARRLELPMATKLSHAHALIGLTGMMTNLTYQVFLYNSFTIATQLVVTFVALVAVLTCGFPALYNAAVNQTSIETMFPMKEFVQIGPHIYVPLGNGFYNRGVRSNLEDILGPSWMLRLLLPVRGAPLDDQVAIAPRPGRAGAEAIKQRIAQVQREGVQREVSTTQELGINAGPDAKSSAVV